MSTRGTIVLAATAAAFVALSPLTSSPRAAADVAVFDLPAPTGPHAVGTTTWRFVDETRRETIANTGGFRNLEVLAWYPASRSSRGEPAPYLREGVAEVRAFATRMRAPEQVFDALASVGTHAIVDAAPAADGGGFPALIFSHGYTGIPSSHTALLEDLASHGYAVFSIVHPYEATAATLADGRVVSMLDETGAPRAELREVFAEWAHEDDAMSAVTRTADEEEQRHLLRDYLSTLHRTDAALNRWVADTKTVLDRLSRGKSSGVLGRVAAKADFTRVGAFGHSMGGVASAAFCIEDRRCRAGLNLDGSPQSGRMIDASPGPPFLMVYSARAGRVGASDAIYRRAARPYYRVDVRDTRHLDFSDMAFWGGPLRERPVLGSISPHRITEITRAIVREYFDQVLLGKPSPLLDRTREFPEVTIGSSAPPRIIGDAGPIRRRERTIWRIH